MLIAVVVAVGSIIVAVVNVAGMRMNTRQHGQSLAALEDLKVDVAELKADMRDVKGDVRDLKDQVRTPIDIVARRRRAAREETE